MKATAYLFLILLWLGAACKQNPLDSAPPIALHIVSGTHLADGVSTAKLITTINKDAGADFRSVRLATKAGEFENGDTAIVIDLRSKSVDTTYLTLGTAAGDFLVTATVGSTTKYSDNETITLKPLAKAQVFTAIHADLTGMLADGQSEVSFSVKLGVKTPVTFKAESGTFHQIGGTAAQLITLTPDGSGEASAIFTVGQNAGQYAFSFETTSPPMDTTLFLNVAPAYADIILIDIPKIQLDSAAGDQFTVTASLSRTIGKVSTGTSIKFPPVTVSGLGTVAFFNPASALATSAGTGTSTLVFPGKTLKVGQTLTFTVTSPQSSGPDLQATRTLTIIK